MQATVGSRIEFRDCCLRGVVWGLASGRGLEMACNVGES